MRGAPALGRHACSGALREGRGGGPLRRRPRGSWRTTLLPPLRRRGSWRGLPGSRWWRANLLRAVGTRRPEEVARGMRRQRPRRARRSGAGEVPRARIAGVRPARGPAVAGPTAVRYPGRGRRGARPSARSGHDDARALRAEPGARPGGRGRRAARRWDHAARAGRRARRTGAPLRGDRSQRRRQVDPPAAARRRARPDVGRGPLRRRAGRRVHMCVRSSTPSTSPRRCSG